MYHRQQLPLGIDDFKEVRENQYYFVDKSLMIKDIIDLDFKVLLLLRPRRFGKTLHLSMLKYFLSHHEKESHLFSNLAISKAGTKYVKMQASKPVIFITLKNIKGETWNIAREKIKKIIADNYKEHQYLLQSSHLSDLEKKSFGEILQKNPIKPH